MWLRFDENGGRQILNTSVCGRILVRDKDIMFYGPVPDGDNDHIIWVLEFKTHEDAVRAHWDIENAICNGDYSLLIEYKFD